jgi:hypothetical protein
MSTGHRAFYLVPPQARQGAEAAGGKVNLVEGHEWCDMTAPASRWVESVSRALAYVRSAVCPNAVRPAPHWPP